MPHIVKSFDEELSKLRERLLRMGALAGQQIDLALETLGHADDALVTRVCDGDAEIDALEHEINEQVVRLLALRSPMADDLRLVVTALKLASDIERIADYAANIARRSKLLSGQTLLPSLRTVRRIGRAVQKQVLEVIDAYAHQDAARAQLVWSADQEIDEMYSGLFRELLTYMMEDPQQIGPASHLLFVAKNIERIGDHATNIGESAYFIITGQRIEGDRPKSDSSSSLED